MTWFKGNTHAHTKLSHGDSTPEVVASWYHDNDYNFLILSEHNRFINPQTVNMPKNLRKDFILVPGEEVSHKTHDGKQYDVHSTAMNITKLVEWKNDSTNKTEIMQQHVDDIEEADGETILNHPNWQAGITAEQILDVERLYMFELYNGHPHVNSYGDHLPEGSFWEELFSSITHLFGGETGRHHLASTETLWDELLSTGMKIYGVSSDDAHEFKHRSAVDSNPGRGWVMVKAKELTGDSITAAMRRGDFYASNGVFLKQYQKSTNQYVVSVDIDRTKAEIEKQYVTGRHTQEKLGFLIEFIGEHGKVLQSSYEPSSTFLINHTEKYIRVKVTYSIKAPQGVQSFYAWGQPVFSK